MRIGRTVAAFGIQAICLAGYQTNMKTSICVLNNSSIEKSGHAYVVNRHETLSGPSGKPRVDNGEWRSPMSAHDILVQRFGLPSALGLEITNSILFRAVLRVLAQRRTRQPADAPKVTKPARLSGNVAKRGLEGHCRGGVGSTDGKSRCRPRRGPAEPWEDSSLDLSHRPALGSRRTRR